jgi:DNA-binding HxlR family transcriptional regulator
MVRARSGVLNALLEETLYAAGMKRSSFEDFRCSVARTLDVIGEWWTPLILRDLFRGIRRFEELQSSLGIARNILADRLRTLEGAGIVERRLYQERPERFEYRLSEKGKDLWPVITALMAWGDRWAPLPEGPPVVLTHTACGHEIVPQMACPACGEALEARSVRAHFGPGAQPGGGLPDTGEGAGGGPEAADPVEVPRI